MDDIYLTKLTNATELSKLVKSLKETNDAHQKLNGELRKELDLVREDNQLLNMENGRMMKKLQN